ncbi:hypothetical protein LEP1GSC145_1147 [Leptospira interrogans serovar Djasiman str. LT1649]|nr:hypothetical protein LEP1GSC007_3630 [Leptospira interrogans serovar Bulgarica str. Mallika]EMM92548.1 hypothetical protein LEP1GSC145_1147 [Leptospira interrogans serovar Djasiman str. LT1649]EMN71810.1 hypothetical protein LEP1GSC100_2972 [Leptospira interrogans serovar Bataviae str. UI 08561]
MFFTSFIIAILEKYNFLLKLIQKSDDSQFHFMCEFPYYRIFGSVFRKRFKVTSISFNIKSDDFLLD